MEQPVQKKEIKNKLNMDYLGIHIIYTLSNDA